MTVVKTKICELVVRRYDWEDRDAVVELWARVFGTAFSEMEKPPVWAAFNRYWDEVIELKQDVWVAVEGDRLVGFISVTATEVCNLFVEIEEQRKGVGTALLQTALGERPGIRGTSTLERNMGARRFYERHGFVLKGVEEHTFEGERKAVYVRAD